MVDSDGNVVQRCTETFTFGERAFKEPNGVRALTAKVVEAETHLLMLTKEDFLDKTFFFEHNQKVKRMNYIQDLPFAEDWEFEKMQHFNSELN